MQNGQLKRLNWGCGGRGEPGWINSDIKSGPRVEHCCDIRHGLPLEEGSVDYAVSVHALQEIPFADVVPVLSELRRVLKPGGVLRLVLPDLEKGIRAYQRGDREYFLVPDEDAKCLSGKFVIQMLWYGYSRTLFTADFIEEMLRNAGFGQVRGSEFRQTNSSFTGITELDSRPRESLFVEAVK
jgi:predicted SAM-dependent methyltransferase